MRRRFGNRLARSTCDEDAAVGVLIDDALSISYTPCTESADDRARRFVNHRTPCSESADDRARRLMPHRTPCIYDADDHARRMMHHRTPCTESADDRARRLMTHRTLCSQSVYDRARRLMHHRTPCTESADDRVDKHDTPCTSSEASPRARTARSASGLSSASRPCSPPLGLPLRPRHRRHSERLS